MGTNWTLSVNATYYQSTNFQMTTKIPTFFKYCVCVIQKTVCCVCVFIDYCVNRSFRNRSGLMNVAVLFHKLIYTYENHHEDAQTLTILLQFLQQNWHLYRGLQIVYEIITISWLEGGILVIQRPLPLYYNMLASSKTDNSLIQASELLGHDCCT